MAFRLSMEPFDADVDPDATALIIIDMQRDFLEPGGFGESLGNDVGLLQRCVPRVEACIDACRERGIGLIYTREGHRPDMSDVFPRKLQQIDDDGNVRRFIGEDGPMGRILIRGEPGHEIVRDVEPIEGEPIIDKPGKGSFYGTDLELILKSRNISTLLVCGVTTEVCVQTTIREANDRGFRAICVGDACASYNEDFHYASLAMISAQGGIFGSVTDSVRLVEALGFPRPEYAEEECEEEPEIVVEEEE
eukprot:CAMPEP_0194047608 /NCGR_PEP_ID=MMETSP0009_2-20130614/25070_1 /TAXON_ID=210454 /ORGANISM="Grammatophora oceanica, Strain CCMP 410" /LENGTH=248 /DNA_ID=CAMNT_0038693271 /DNA_START=149 /DNA_END=895 /DNA_ORIENTATION=+